MNTQNLEKSCLWRSGLVLAAIGFTSALATAGQPGRGILVLTSTNNASGNAVVVFAVNTEGTPSLSHENTLPTGGKGGASTNAGILQFENDLGAVANYGSNTVSLLERAYNSIVIGKAIPLASDCVKPDSVALTQGHLFVVGANCAETHAWPWGYVTDPL